MNPLDKTQRAQGAPQKPHQNLDRAHRHGTVQRKTAAAQVRQPPPVYRPQPVPRVLQTKLSAPLHQGINQSRRALVAPPVYQPQPVPKVLQTKVVLVGQPPASESRHKPAAPAIYRPQPEPRVLQSKLNGAQPEAHKGIAPQQHAPATPYGLQRAIVQPFISRVAQAVKYYPNLHPGAVEPVEPGNIFKLKSFADQYRLNKVNSHSVNVPNQLYNFVRTREGEMLLHNRYRHPSIAEGQQVLYAGEVFFNNGKLEWWSNGSGHYQPDVEDAEQASLPMDYFYSYQQVIKGEHKRKQT